MLLGEKEKYVKDKRMATVAAVDFLKEKSQADVMFELVEGTRFSPILPRLELAFEIIVSSLFKQIIHCHSTLNG